MREHTVPTLGGREPFELASRSLLLCGMPNSDKSVLFNLTAAHTALTAEQADTDRRSAAERPEVA